MSPKDISSPCVRDTTGNSSVPINNNNDNEEAEPVSTSRSRSSSVTDLYSVLDHALRTQMDQLDLSALLTSPRNNHPNASHHPKQDDDDGMDGELSRLSDAERAMREELANAVFEMGMSSLQGLDAAGAGGILSEIGDRDTAGEDGGDDDDDVHTDEQVDVDHEDAVAPVPADDASVTSARRSEADLINERDLMASLNELCRWIREGRVYLEDDTIRKGSSARSSHHPTPRDPIGSILHSTSKTDDTVTNFGTLDGTIEGYENQSTGGAQVERERQQSDENDNIAIEPLRPSSLGDFPVDELCKWLSEYEHHHDTSRSASVKKAERTVAGKPVTADISLKRNTRKSTHTNQSQTDIPKTFHLQSGGTSSVLVLGARGNRLRSPSPHSPLKKPYK